MSDTNDNNNEEDIIKEDNFWVFIIIFMIYSLAGSILEHFMYFIGNKKKIIINPILTGFPIYGLGAYLIVWISRETKDKIHPIVEFFIYAFILSSIEYAAGILIGAGKNSYTENGYIHGWDYSNDRYNLDGIVKLSNFVAFGVIGLVVARLHPILVEQVNKLFE